MSIRPRGKIWLLAILTNCSIVAAAPMWGVRMEFQQPDGSTVPVLMYGDEYYQRVESLDSLTLVRDTAGWIDYARISDDSSAYVPTGVHYTGRASTGSFAARSLGATEHASISEDAAMAIRDSVYRQLNRADRLPDYPTRPVDGGYAGRSSSTNSVRRVVGLTIPVDFSDAPATIAQESIDDMMNEEGYNEYGNNGSVYQFYREVSNGHLLYTNIVTRYVRLSRPKAYYNNPKIAFGSLAQVLVTEALDSLQRQGFDFSKLTTDGSNNVYALNVLYAGASPSTWAVGLWPHKGSLGGVVHGGKNFSVYELSNLGTAPDIGVLCHENGHMVMGWPDLYDYSYKTQGTGGYDLMSSAFPHNPVRPGAYLRDEQGWDSVVRLDTLAAGQILLPSNQGFSARYDNPLNAKEHFYVESCRKTGRGANLPDEGLMIWHVDENGSNNNGQRTATKHYKVSLEQADGKFDLESKRSTGSGDLFHSGYKDNFGPATTPNSKWWSGKASDFRVTGVGPVADTMSFFWSGGKTNPLRPAVKPTKPVAGLLALYGEGSWTEIPAFALGAVKSTSTAAALTGTVTGAASSNYAIGYDGYFLAPSEGAYTFTSNSDAAVRVWMDGNLEIDQKTSFSGQDNSFTPVLAKGYHLLRVNYLHGGGSPALSLKVAGPTFSGVAIPAANLFHESTPVYADDPTFLSSSSLGLRYSYFEGTWSKLPKFDTLTPVRTGLTQTIGTNGVGTIRKKDIGLVFEGYVNAAKLASYTFYLSSADGSRLTLDGATIINSDGLHASKTVSASRKLYPGLHAIKVEYFQHSHTAALALKYSTTGVSKRVIPAGMFYNDSTQGLAPNEGMFPADSIDEMAIDAPVPSISDASIRMIGGMLRIELPEDYQGEAIIDLVDASGRILNSIPARVAIGSNEVYVKHRGSSNMVIVRIRMDGRVISKMVPLTF